MAASTTYDEDDAGTAEGGAQQEISTPSESDEQLKRKLKRWERLAKQHWSAWKDEMRQAFDFVAGKQWSSDDKSALLDQMRQPVTFNRIAPMVDAVTGAEILNRQETRYSPRQQGAVQVNELITAADEWARDLADTEDEESDAFADVVICGMGWTETRMDYSEDPEGRIMDDRIDPIEMLSDPQAKKRCLADARYLIRSRWRDKVDLPEKWRRKIMDQGQDGGPGNIDDMGYGRTGPRDDYDREDSSNTQDNADKRQVFVRHFQWFDQEDAYRISDEMTGQAVTIDRTKLKQITKMFMANGMKPPPYVKIQTNKYRYAIMCGDVIVERDDIESNAFTFKCITGKRDRNANTFYGVVRAMIDPQMWGNKFFVQVMHILNTAAKGGLLYESGSFANARKAIEDWSKPDAAIELQRGALTGQKAAVQERQPTVFPVGLDKMMEFSLNNLPQTSGINLEMLGLVERDQPGVLEAHRKKAGYAILAVFFDSLRRYRKMKGRLRLYFIQNYISDGRLIKIKGQDSTLQYVPLVKQPDTVTYDVIVDDAPMSPNQKEQTWMMMQAMMPMLAKLNVPPEVWQIMLEYSPLPSSVSEKISAVLKQASAQPPPPDPKMEQIKAKSEADQAKIAADIQRDQQKAQADMVGKQHDMEMEKVKLAIEVEKSRAELIGLQQKNAIAIQGKRMDIMQKSQEHQLNLDFAARGGMADLAHQHQMGQEKIATERAKRRIQINRDGAGRMTEIVEH